MDMMTVNEEIEYFKSEIRKKEIGELEPLLIRFYHLLKLLKPKIHEFSKSFKHKYIINKLKDSCGAIESPREVLAARVLGGISRILCLSSDLFEGIYKMRMRKLSKPAKRLAKSISLFSEEERYEDIDYELGHLCEQDDEDICLNTIAYYRYQTVKYGGTPIIGEERHAFVGNWLFNLLSNKYHSVVIETIKMTKKLSSLRVYLIFGKTVKKNNILALDSFLPDPNAFNSRQASVGLPKCNSSDWIPPVYSRGAICCMAFQAFECLCRLSAKHIYAFVHILTCQDKIVEKVFCYLFGSWTEEEWKAIFPGSRFLDASCSDIYSSGGANFQHMIDGLYCEEQSVQKMISKFQMCAIMFIRCFLVKQTYESITRCMKRDFMRRIASLSCDTTNDLLRLEAAKALLDGWVCVSLEAQIRPLREDVDEEDIENYSCLPQPLRGELKAMLAEACEEEGVIDTLNAHLAPNLSEDVVKAKKDERIRRRLKAKCDPSICPVCAMYADADINYNEMGREDKKEKEKRVKDTEVQFHDLLDSTVKEEEKYFGLLKKCVNAGEMSSNVYSKILFGDDWASYYYIDDCY